jgi:hypothetical protein
LVALLESLLLAGGVADGLLLDELLGVELLLPEVAPPEAAPELDLEGSELGVVAELPPEGEVDEEELEPELDGGGVEDDGEEELLLPLPLVPLLDLPPPLSWPQAARPKAMATATARVESFMCPPWLGYERKQQRTGRA